jgi:peptidylprolyl isomerase
MIRYNTLDDYVEVVPVENVPLKNIEIGNRIWLAGDDGEKYPVTILDITAKEVTFDMNHPLAGKDLTFEVEILDVDEPEGEWEQPVQHSPLEYIEQLGM